jgi:hypothetical protein
MIAPPVTPGNFITRMHLFIFLHYYRIFLIYFTPQAPQLMVGSPSLPSLCWQIRGNERGILFIVSSLKGRKERFSSGEIILSENKKKKQVL